MRCFNLTGLIVIIILSISCKQRSTEEANLVNAIDSTKIIEAGVAYIFKTVHFADDYYSNPLKIVKSKNVPPTIAFFVNGLKTEIVDEKPSSAIINNWAHPQPYLEVLELKNFDKNRILLKLLFRTTGNEFAIFFKKNEATDFRVDSLSHSHL